MSEYEIHCELMRFIILKDNKQIWKGQFKLSWSGFGFVAKDNDDNDYTLKSSGILFWRELRLLRNSDEIDRIKIYKSLTTGFLVKRNMDVFLNDKLIFSIERHRSASNYGHKLISWEYNSTENEPVIFTLLLALIQNSGKVFASAAP